MFALMAVKLLLLLVNSTASACWEYAHWDIRIRVFVEGVQDSQEE
jgi:hypothetical protein